MTWKSKAEMPGFSCLGQKQRPRSHACSRVRVRVRARRGGTVECACFVPPRRPACVAPSPRFGCASSRFHFVHRAASRAVWCACRLPSPRERRDPSCWSLPHQRRPGRPKNSREPARARLCEVALRCPLHRRPPRQGAVASHPALAPSLPPVPARPKKGKPREGPAQAWLRSHVTCSLLLADRRAAVSLGVSASDVPFTSRNAPWLPARLHAPRIREAFAAYLCERKR